MKTKSTLRPRRAALILAVVVSLFFIQSLGAFWFICSYRDAAKAAKVAAKARERYYEYMGDIRSQRAQVEACKAAWDSLRNATFSEIADFIRKTPGTTFNPETDAKGLIKKAIKEAIKEVLGEIISISIEGVPTPVSNAQAGEYTRPHGEMVASLAFQNIPIEFSETNITALELSYLTPADYDNSEGDPPPGWTEETPLIMISGTFSAVPVGSIFVDAINPVAGAYGGMTYTLTHLKADLLENPLLLQGSFDNGYFSNELIEWLVQQDYPWDMFDKIGIGMDQVGSIEITEVDSANGTISGQFFSVAGGGPLWNNGGYDGMIQTPSELGTGAPEARAADDFELPLANGRNWKIKSITVQLIQNSDFLVNNAIVEIYMDSGLGSPAEAPPIATIQAIGSSTIGIDSATGIQIQEYIFDIADLTLSPGRYWLAAIGMGDNSGLDRAFFASANYPNIRLSQGHFKSAAAGVPNWLPIQDVFGTATDLAFTLDADIEQNITDVPNVIDTRLAKTFALNQNYPNPFNPETKITFQFPQASQVTLRIFNILGKEIKTLVNEQYQAGKHTVNWDGKDNLGNVVSSGIYFYQLRAGNFTQAKKMILLR